MDDGSDIIDWTYFEKSRAELGPGFIRILSYFREDGAKSLEAIEQAMRELPVGVVGDMVEQHKALDLDFPP